jgi:hypothetical protein
MRKKAANVSAASVIFMLLDAALLQIEAEGTGDSDDNPSRVAFPRPGFSTPADVPGHDGSEGLRNEREPRYSSSAPNTTIQIRKRTVRTKKRHKVKRGFCM